MATIQGVLGPIETEQLGFTLMHEHVLVADWSMRHCFPGYVDEEAVVAEAIRELRAAKERGVDTLVDLTPINLGRDIRVIRAVSEGAGVPIIAATGFYWNEEPWMEAWEVAKLADYLIREIEEGIEDTGIRAGIIKCATDRHGVTPLNEKLLSVAARAHRATGVPISTHTSVAHRTGPAQQDVFEREGVDLSRVVIGHCGDSEDIAYLEEILKRGSTIGMDRFGIDIILPTKQRVATIVELCNRGWSGQMVLSHDASCHIDWFPKEAIRQAVPRWNYRHISDDVIPALRESGVPDAQVHEMTVTNPRRIFARQGAYPAA
jgi:phosphotriesterase-related protein